MPAKAQEDVKSDGSGSMQSLSGVAASKVCWEWQHLKSVGSGSIQSLSGVAASKVCRKWQHRSLSLEGQNMRSLSVGWQHIRLQMSIKVNLLSKG